MQIGGFGASAITLHALHVGRSHDEPPLFHPRFRRSVILFLMRPNLLAPSALILAAMSQFVFAQAPASVASQVADQNALFEDAWQANLKMNPIRATSVVHYRYNDQLGDYSLAANATRHQRDRSDLA